MKLFKKRKYNIAVFGADGMLGYDVVKYFNAMLLKKNSCIGVVKAFGKSTNILKYGILYSIFDRYRYTDDIKYDIVVNCAAMTDVNKIETDNGRNLTEAESDKIAIDLKNMLKDYDIPYTEVNGDLLSADKIVDDVLLYLNNKVPGYWK